MNFLLNLVLFTFLQLILITRLTTSYSQLWGELHPLAMAIYEIDFELSRDMIAGNDSDEDAFVDVFYPRLGTKNNYIITMMLVLDGRKERKRMPNNPMNEEAEVGAFILEGGIGLNYTRVRFLMQTSAAYINFIIYGVHPKAFDM